MNRRQHLRILLAASSMIHSACTHSQSTTDDIQIDSGELVRPCQGSPGHLRLPYKHYHRGIPGRPVGVFLGGGPGVSNLDFTPPDTWLEIMDLLVLEYRGAGQCKPVLNTPFFMQALEQPIPQLGLTGTDSLQAKLAQGFDDLRHQGIVFSDYGLTALADDVQALREELELPPLILIAHSFGTRIAQTMQTRHRASVHGSLLLSGNTPGGLIWYPDETQSVWRRWCSSTEALDSGLADPIRQMLETGWDRQGRWHDNDSRALILSFFMSFNNASRLKAMKTLLAARRGSSAVWWLMGKSFSLFARFSFNWADFFVKGYVSDAERQAVALCDQQGRKALFQSPSSILFAGVDGFLEAGGQREVQPPVDYRNTLLVTGEFDPSTPIERWPDSVPASQRIVLPGGGHVEALHAARQHGQPWLRQLVSTPKPESIPS